MEELLTKFQELIAEYGLCLLGAVVILLVGRWVAKLLRNLVRRLLLKSKLDNSLVSFVSQLTYVALMIFVILAALGVAKVPINSFVAMIAAAGLAVGFALGGSLANFASGVLLIIFRPFKVDDFIEGAGIKGTVEEISIFTTQLRTPDNRTVIVPNAKLTGDNIINYSAKGTRRVDLVIGVSYADDLKKVRKVLEGILANDDRVLNDPPPQIAVSELADSSVNFVVRPWVKATDYWDVYFDTTEAAKRRFDAEGISIPFPQHDVHIYKE